eukprot:jgi/Psemu1/194977/e_gw1.165.45.1
MGGDGGVIASNRKFMRGAGTADCVGDIHKHAAQKFNAKEAMSTCALTKTPLHSTSGAATIIVADPYGHLYHKEAAVQALLKRKQQGNSNNNNNNSGESTIGPQVRRLADLCDVRFHRDEPSGVKNSVPTCPISGKALNGSIPAVVLVPGKKGVPNVVTESTISQLTPEELEAEFGVILKKVRLAPNPVLLEQIKEEVRLEQEQDEEQRRRAKKEKKKEKKSSKRKRAGARENAGSSSEKKKKSDGDSNHKEAPLSKSNTSSLGQQVQSRVDSAIQQNSVLSSLFTNKSASSKISEKDKKDNLFAR